MKKWLAYIFLIIFSFQVLPVKEIGKILFKGQMTEEIHESHTDESCNKLKKNEPYKLYDAEIVARIQYFESKIQTAIHEAERLPKDYVPDIFTPPPNFI